MYCIILLLTALTGDLKMNVWHDISFDRIAPEDFIAVVEISKEAKTNTN